MGTRTTPRGPTLRSSAFPAPLGPRLAAAVAAAHADEPFRPTAPRDAARRLVRVVERFGLTAVVYRGGVDVGAAEIDHIWVVADERVIDAAFPLHAPSFVDCIRAFVAGDVDENTLERTAHPYSVAWRVIGSFPDPCRYVGEPVWSDS
jgi:hypothetical protein